MKIRIPVLVSDENEVSSALYGKADGSDIDIGFLYDSIEGDRTCLVWVEAEIDVEALFKPANVTGKVAEAGDVE